MRQHPERKPECDQGGDQRRPAQGVLPVAGDEEQDQHAHQREEGQKSKRLQKKFHVPSSIADRQKSKVEGGVLSL